MTLTWRSSEPASREAAATAAKSRRMERWTPLRSSTISGVGREAEVAVVLGDVVVIESGVGEEGVEVVLARPAPILAADGTDTNTQHQQV